MYRISPGICQQIGVAWGVSPGLPIRHIESICIVGPISTPLCGPLKTNASLVC